MRLLRCCNPLARKLKAKIEQIGVEHIGLAVASDLLDAPRVKGGAHFRAVESELAWKAGKARHRSQTGVVARLEHGKHVHQVEMARVIAVEVAVVSEVLV